MVSVLENDLITPFPAAVRNHRPRPRGESSAIMEEEDALADYLRAVARYPLLSAQEEHALFLRLQAGEVMARQHLIEANLRLVIAIARDYAKTGVPLLDLIQYGNLGLIEAVDGFDPQRGTRLSTYAYWWIHALIRRYVPQEAAIRLPAYQQEKLARLKQARYTLARTLGCAPTQTELAEATGLSLATVKELLHISAPMRSLEEPLVADDNLALGHSLVDKAVDVEKQTIDALHLQEQRHLIAQLCQELSPRERMVIASRFGLHDGQEQRLEAIGNMLGVTRERVRQIEQRALEKMHRQAQRMRTRSEAHLR